jgi:hypothetical protein
MSTYAHPTELSSGWRTQITVWTLTTRLPDLLLWLTTSIPCLLLIRSVPGSPLSSMKSLRNTCYSLSKPLTRGLRSLDTKKDHCCSDRHIAMIWEQTTTTQAKRCEFQLGLVSPTYGVLIYSDAKQTGYCSVEHSLICLSTLEQN